LNAVEWPLLFLYPQHNQVKIALYYLGSFESFRLIRHSSLYSSTQPKSAL
jgi:hypothetical protein